MKTITIQTERIAQAGAKKMSAQGYTFTPADDAGAFYVQKPGAAKPYLTDPNAEPILTYCSCPFAQENGLCKHIVWLRDELARDAADVARWEAEAEAREEFATFGKYL